MISYMYANGSLHRQGRFEPISLHMEPRTGVEPDKFLNECAARAVHINQKHPDAYIALSGGVESQVCLRSFLEAGIKPRVLIMRFNDRRNEFDVNPAKITAKNFGIEPEIIDIAPNQIVENHGIDLIKQYQLYTLFDLLVAHVVKTLQIPLIVVDKYDIRRDVDPDKTWCLVRRESGFWSKRFNSIEPSGRIVDDFFTTNRLLLSFLKLHSVQSLISGEIPGKISLTSTKREVFTQAGIKHIMNYKPTDHTYYFSGLRNSISDKIYNASLFEDRKLYIPIDEYQHQGAKTTWRHI